VILEAVRLRTEHPTAALAAKAGGITPRELTQRLVRAAQRGLDGSVPKPAPPGFVVKGTTTLYKPDGSTVLQWVRNTDEPSLEDIAAAMRTAFDGFKGFGRPIARPAHARADLCTLTPIGDLHVGMYAWEGDSGTNWDLKIAEAVIGEAVDQTVLSSEKSGLGIVLFGGDYFHADNKNNETSKSRNPLDVDGRYDKVIEVGTRLAVRIIDRHLAHHDKVLARALKGNHDEHSSVALAWFLKAYYRNEPRVTIDVDASLFFWHRFGEVMIGSTHGHETKLAKLPQVMAVRRAADWGATKFRFCHGFHLHHADKLGFEDGGCISEVHQTITPQDTWNFGRGFLSGQSLSSITYHKNAGEVGRKRTVIMDNVVLPANDNIKKQKAA
jgi:hypothetical protein